ncbi:MAG: hypothetical protein L0211_21240 [Planctomycetaceae bacterium]|nr:hypothetical protein [Planctomycetaceae bacterium]
MKRTNFALRWLLLIPLQISPAFMGLAYFRSNVSPFAILTAFVLGLVAYVATFSILKTVRRLRAPSELKGSIVGRAILDGVAYAACFGLLAIGALELLAFWEMSDAPWDVILDDGIRYVVIGLAGIGYCITMGAAIGGVVGLVAGRRRIVVHKSELHKNSDDATV